MHCPNKRVRRELAAEGILPHEFWSNWEFCTFDVECFMDPEEDSRNGLLIHRLVSIAVKSSFGSEKESEHYLQRENMEPLSCRVLVQDFLSLLVHLRGEMFKYIPKSVIDGQARYLQITKSKDFRKRPVERQAVVWEKLRFLNGCLALRIYSYNGERYDHNVVWAPMMDIFADDQAHFDNLSIIRRGTGIMQFSDGALIFRDFLNMTSPMSLDKFSESCGITDAEKTTFPYELFSDIETLRQTVEFPAFKHFRSSLANDKSKFIEELEKLVTDNVRNGIWQNTAAANSFFGFEPPIQFEAQGDKFFIAPGNLAYAKTALHTSPKKYYSSKKVYKDEKCESMEDYLKIYNMNDCILLVKCIRSYAEGFFKSWQVNIHEKMSLPGVAQHLAFKYYDEKATAIYTLGKSFTEYNEKIRQQLHGGMTLAKGS